MRPKTTILIMWLTLSWLFCQSVSAQIIGRFSPGRSTPVSTDVMSLVSQNVPELIYKPQTKFGSLFSRTRTLPKRHSSTPLFDAASLAGAEALLPTLRGVVISSTTRTAHRMWSFTPDGNNFLNISGNNEIAGNWAGILVGDTFYQGRTVKDNDGNTECYIDAYNAETWVRTSTVKVPVTSLPVALAYDNGSVYGCFNNGTGGYMFGRMALNATAGYPVTRIVDNCMFHTMVIDENNKLWALDFNGALYQVDKTTGSKTLISNTDIATPYISSGCYDKDTRAIYWNVMTEEGASSIYRVSLPSGYVTKMGTLSGNDEIIGMHIPETVSDGVPGQATDLAAHFANGALSGTVSFKVPTTTKGGQTGAGALTYRVLANGKQVANGTTAYGAEVTTETIVLPSAGNYTFSVILTNAEGDSQSADITLFIGKDTPKSPTVNAVYGNGKFTVSWNPVSESVNGGYINPSEVTYTVTRFPGEVTVASNITDTTFYDAVSIPEKYCVYYYTVTAAYNGNVSAPGESNHVSLNENTTPWSTDFSTQDDFDLFTVIDANKDGNKFEYKQSNKSARIKGNTAADMDDWLIAPPLKLKASQLYKFSTYAFSDAFTYAPDIIEVYYGKEPKAEAMTKVIVPRSNIYWGTDFSEYFKVDEDGIYYIGIHGCSPAYDTNVFIDKIMVEEVDGRTPGTVTDLKITLDPKKPKYATISGKAPAVNAAGGELTAIESVVVERNGNKVGTANISAAGDEFSMTVKVGSANYYEFDVYAVNTYGPGPKVQIGEYIGLFEPTGVENLNIKETVPGTVEVKWEAPKTDIHGHVMLPSNVTYSVYNVATGDVLAENLTDTTYTWKVNDGKSQIFASVAVVAATTEGKSNAVVSNMLPVGQPLLPTYIESFDNGEPSTPVGVEVISGESAKWTLCQNGQLLSDDADGTGGFVAAQFGALDDEVALYTAKVDLKNAMKPTFSFATYNIFSDSQGYANTNEVRILLQKTGESDDTWHEVLKGTVDELCKSNRNAWGTVSVNLDAFKGSVVRLAIRVVAKSYSYVPIDVIKVHDNVDINLTAANFAGPSSAKRGEKFELRLSVANNGINAISGNEYSVELYKNGGEEPVMTLPGVDLASMKSASMALNQTYSFNDPDTCHYHAKVVYEADQKQSDNVSSPVTVLRTITNREAPANLTVTAIESVNGASLKWESDLFSKNDFDTITDDFESYPSFANSGVGEWTFIDADQEPVGGFDNIEIPGIPKKSLQSFFVFDASHENFSSNSTFKAHSGNKYLASLYCLSDDDEDDWLISPELSGKAQTIRFFAKSYSSDYAESFNVYYSTTGKTTDDFKAHRVKRVSSVPKAWTEYTVDIPEGAKYFAIRSMAYDNYMLQIDDITYERRIDKPVGFNIYRDDEKVNTAPVTELSYLDPNVKKEAYYRVTAVYADGSESEPSNAALYKPLAVEGITTGLNITSGNGIINVAGAEGISVSIFNTNALVAYSGIPRDVLRVRVNPGIWFVRVGKEKFQLLVK